MIFSKLFLPVQMDRNYLSERKRREMKAILFLVLILGTFADDLFAPRYHRTVLQFADAVPPPNALLSVLDVNHQRMKVFYSDAQVTSILNDGYAWINSQFGINFAAPPAFPIASLPGAIFHPLGTLYPYGQDSSVVQPYQIAADSRNKKRGDQDLWMITEYGFLILLNGQGTFPGGNQSGTTYAQGSILTYGFYNWLRVGGDWNTTSDREQVLFYSEQPSSQFVNSQGQFEERTKVTVVDSTGRVGYNQGTSTTTVNPDGSKWRRMRSVSTWDWLPGEKQNAGSSSN